MHVLQDKLPPPQNGRSGWPWTGPEASSWPAPASGWPKLTVITPSFRQGDYIEETIRSVLLQGYPNLEYMVFDAGSEDGTKAILERYEPFLAHVESRPDNGQSNAINKGLARATGDAINWINSDDYYDPGALFRVGQAFAASNETLCVAGRSRLFRPDGSRRESRGTDVYPSAAKSMGWARIDQPETFFRAKALEAMGPLNESLHYCMDREWWLRFLMHFGVKPIQRLEAILVNFRLHEASKTVSLGREFQRERDAIYLGLAQALQDHNTAAEINLWYLQAPLQPVAPDVPAELFQTKRNELQAALQYFLLLAANEAYEALDMERTRRILKRIDPAFLATPDREWRKVLWRRTWFPKPLLSLARRFSR